jgi:hypothetical protein
VRTSTRFGIGLVVAAAVACCSMPGIAQPAAKTCDNAQSPRVLENYGQRPSFSIDRAPASEGDAIVYVQRPQGRRYLLRRCGQHYHCHVENVQPHCGQKGAAGECGQPTPGSWVEIHTVYSVMVGTGCDPETLDCCLSTAPTDPVLVMAHHAKVTSDGPPLQPLPLPWGFDTARWSGSTTGTKPPTECKPAAKWNFMLGCDFTVSVQQLKLFHHFDQARPLQHQLSNDLTHDPPH